MGLSESWAPLAQTLGFSSEDDMLKHFYVAQGLSLKDMSAILGFSTFSIRRRLRKIGVPIRKRGGPNRQDKSLLSDVSDQELFEGSPAELAETHGVSMATVFNERRRRKLNALLSDHANKGLPGVWPPNKVSHGSGSAS